MKHSLALQSLLHSLAGLLLPLSLAALPGCSGGGSGPDEAGGTLRITADDLDGPVAAIAPAGFEVGEVTTWKVRVNAGPRTVVDSTFAGGTGPFRVNFRVRPDTYLVLVEGFQASDVLLFNGATQATVAADDTASAAIDLDPALGPSEFVVETPGGSGSVATNGTAVLRVVVRNTEGRPVSGATVAFGVEPATLGEVAFDGSPETGSDGTLRATFVPARREGTGAIRLTIDGLPAAAGATRALSVVSPVSATLSTVEVSNDVLLPADGVTPARILVRVVDAAGIPQAGIPVVVRSSRNGPGDALDTIRSDQTVTDAAGQFLATLVTFSSSNLAGDVVVTAEADGKVISRRPSISVRSLVNASLAEIRVVPQTVPANGVSAAQADVTVRGPGGATLPNVLVRLQTKDDSLFRIEPASARTNASGTVRFRISSTVRTGTILDVFADGLKTSAVGFVLFQ
ncbi:MAG: hypothetical protein H0V09_04015 [Gemmatimonadetes bacterium]|nr:hypothetical protein [Gemmatimonadota bacterium]